MWSSQRSMDNADKCVQIYELSTNTTSRMIYAFAKDRTCPLPATALPHSDSSAQTNDCYTETSCSRFAQGCICLDK